MLIVLVAVLLFYACSVRDRWKQITTGRPISSLLVYRPEHKPQTFTLTLQSSLSFTGPGISPRYRFLAK